MLTDPCDHPGLEFQAGFLVFSGRFGSDQRIQFYGQTAVRSEVEVAPDRMGIMHDDGRQ